MIFRQGNLWALSLLVLAGGILSIIPIWRSAQVKETVISHISAPKIGGNARVEILETLDQRFAAPHDMFYSLRIMRPGDEPIVLMSRMETPPLDLQIRENLVYVFRVVDGGFHLDCFNVTTRHQVMAEYSNSLTDLRALVVSGP